MKVLVVHNSYQHSGGEDAVFRSEVNLLRGAGHEVREYLEDNHRIQDMNPIRLGAKTIWSATSRKRIRNQLGAFHADIAHFHNTFPLISPSAYYACEEAGVPVVQTLHNYRLLCPGALLYREGKVCEDCLHKRVKWPGIVHACYRENRLATAATAGMVAVHHGLGTWKQKVARYIALSEFSRRKFIEGGLPAAKIDVKPNFVSPDPGTRRGIGDYALYVGRLSAEKGPQLLLSAWKEADLSVSLRIIGDGPLRQDLEREKEKAGLSAIEFNGSLANDSVFGAMKAARFLIAPSECYENSPLAVAEAYACGVPAIAARLGALGEVVRDGVTGLHFEPGNAEDLAAKVKWAWAHPVELEAMGRAARAEYEAKYTAEKNYQVLMRIYREASTRKK